MNKSIFPSNFIFKLICGYDGNIKKSLSPENYSK